LFSKLDIPAAQTHLPDAMAADLQMECCRYDRMLAEHPIDLQLLGLGHNGHIGFNEPGSSLQGTTHVVELKPETRAANARFFLSPGEVPIKAVTMGIGAILKSRRILLVVRGADKADILYQALKGPITTACPASLLQTHANVTVLTDKDAGRKLINDIQNGQLAHY
jgi:glucosamine-6-phosphate deaminase